MSYRKACILIALCSLAGCATAPPPRIETVTVTKVVTPDIPASLFDILPVPAVPIITLGDVHGGSESSTFMVQDHVSNEVCHEHMSAIQQALP